jgi:hypothetical protein
MNDEETVPKNSPSHGQESRLGRVGIQRAHCGNVRQQVMVLDVEYVRRRCNAVTNPADIRLINRRFTLRASRSISRSELSHTGP